MIKIHKVKVTMTKDEVRIERYLNGLTGKIIAIIPNTCEVWGVWGGGGVNFLWVIEEINP